MKTCLDCATSPCICELLAQRRKLLAACETVLHAWEYEDAGIGTLQIDVVRAAIAKAKTPG